MHTSTLYFWLWFFVLGVVPVLVAWPTWSRASRLPALLYPIAAGGLLWLHGVWFDPPNNMAVLDEYGFLGFWFKPHRDFEIREGFSTLVLLSLPAFLVPPLALGALRRSAATSRGVLVAIPLLVFAFLCLRGIPDHIMDLLHHRPYAFSSPDDLVEDVLPGVLVRTVFAAPGLIVGGVLWFRFSRAGAESQQRAERR